METDSSSQGRSGAAVSAPPSGHHHHHHRRHRSQRSWWHAWRRRWHHLLTGMAQVPMCGLLILLVMLPLIYQGGEYWWLPVATSLVLVLYVFWGLSAWWLGGETGRWHWHAGMLLFALPLGLGLAQAMPIPDGLVTRLSPSGWPWWEGLRQLGLGDIRPSLSLAPDYTLRTCELLLLCLLTFTLLLQQARHRAALRLVAAAVALSAFVNAAYAFWEFWRDDTGGGMLQMTVFKGAFLNRNHFGFMMHLGALSAMGLLAAVGAAGRRQRDDTSPAWGGILIPMTFMLFGILTAQVLSLSRGAFMATVTAAMCFGLIWLVRGARVAGGRQKVLALAMILGAALLMALPPALSRLSERYQHLLDSESFDGEDRLMVWRDTVALIKDFPWAGTGLGAYGDAIQPYERGVFRDGLIEHAHNDWLEMTAEVGLPMALVIIGLAGWLLGGATRRIWRQKDMTMRWIGLGALAAVLGGLMHEVVDFNLLAMPNAMLFSALLALVFICGRHRSGAVSGPSPAEGGDGRGFVPVGEPLTETLVATEDGTGRWRPRRLVFLAGALVVLAALPWQFRRCQAAWRHMQLYDEVESAGRGWQPGWKDYQRRVALADAALAGFPGHPAILRLRALSLAPLAFLLPGESLELMAAARSDSAAACRRLPADGDTLRIGANIHEQAGLLDGRVDEGLVLGLYERALASQPRITNMLREVAEARRRSFHRLAVREGLAAPATVQSRQRALELYLEYLQAGGGYSQDLFAVIMELTDSQKQLLDILPQDSRMNRVLFDFLVSRQDYGQAFELQAKMESELPVVTDGAREAVESRRDWLGRQAQLLGLAGQWPARAKLMPEYLGLAAAVVENRLVQVDAMLADGKVREAGNYLLGLRREAPVSYPALLREAEVSLSLGKADQAPHILLPFAYGVLDPPSPAQLSQALDLLGQIGEQGFATFNIRERFLRVVLPLLLAEAAAGQALPIGLEWAGELEGLEKTLADDDRVSWLQRHLLPYYAGRAYELAGAPDRAREAYRRSLDLSPGNILPLLRLEKLGPGGAEQLSLGEPDRSLLALYHEVRQTAPVMARFTSALAWCGLVVRPPAVQHFHESIEVDYLWLCTGDVQFDCTMEVEMANADGRLYADSLPLAQGDRSTVGWRVGELVAKRRQYSPMLQMARGGNPVRNCQVTATVRMRSHHAAARRLFEPVPPAMTPAFQVVGQ